MTSTPTLVRAFLLGVATGGRTTAGSAALVWSASPAIADRDPLWLSGRPAHVVTALMVAGEVGADKLPSTPSRLQPPALMARVIFGAVGGGFLARRHAADAVPVAVVGALGALAGSFLGSKWRAWAAKQFGLDLPGAVIEDVVIAGLAVAAVR